MEFLKDILGDELYQQIVSKINEHNGAEANKDNQIKLANLATGEYVGKGKYDALDTQYKGKETELASANALIENLKNASKGNEDAQQKISQYESEVATLQQQLAESKLNAAIKVGLLAANVVDVDYLAYKLKEKGEKLELDENGNIKGWDDKIAGLKTQLPNMFGAEGSKKFEEKKLPEGDPGAGTEPTSLAEALKMQYESK